jgi:hypothetical protein
MKYQIVVARYKEDISWTKNVENVIVYDKSPNPVEGAIARPNVGREAETFIWHILQNYDNLPDHLIFLQGNPFPHMNIWKINVENLSDTVKPYQTDFWPEHNNRLGALRVKEYYKYLFDGQCPEYIYFVAGAQYSVPRKAILFRPKSFYRKLVDMLTAYPYVCEPDDAYGFVPDTINAWTVERLMFYIFTNSMDNYISKVPNVASSTELCSLICSIGLFNDERGIYGQYNDFMRPSGQGGLWQNPMELATFLWDNRQLFSQVRSYLDIGTFNGFTTFVIVEFLRAHVSRDIRVKTIDPNIHFSGQDTERYIRPYFSKCTIDSLEPGEEYDLVFIDGLHEKPGPSHDFDSVKNFAKFVFFHDIADKYCPYVVETFDRLSSQYESKRTCLTDGVFGIGLIIL